MALSPSPSLPRWLLPLAVVLAVLFGWLIPQAHSAEPEGLLSLTATPAAPDAERWAFNGWAGAGYSFLEPNGRESSSADEAFTHSLLVVQNPATSGEMFMPFATETFAMTLGEEGFVQVTEFLSLGLESDSWAGWMSYRESQPDQTAGGIAYWLDAFVEADETRYKPIRLMAGVSESGGMVGEIAGWWPISGGHPFSYMAIGRAHYEEQGDSYLDVALRHHTSADLSAWFELGVFNIGPHWGTSFNVGTTF